MHALGKRPIFFLSLFLYLTYNRHRSRKRWCLGGLNQLEEYIALEDPWLRMNQEWSSDLRESQYISYRCEYNSAFVNVAPQVNTGTFSNYSILYFSILQISRKRLDTTLISSTVRRCLEKGVLEEVKIYIVDDE